MQAILNVLPNPWAAVDGVGRPSGTYPEEPSQEGGVWGFDETRKRFIGAALEHEDGETRVVHATEPVRVYASLHYRNAVKSGELLAADAATARACGIDFVEPAEVIARSKAARAAEWLAERGEAAPWLAPVAPAAAASAPEAPAPAPAPAPADASPAAEAAPAKTSKKGGE
jgi:hypothetical protein